MATPSRNERRSVVVDWVELTLETREPTQAHHLWQACGGPASVWFKGCDSTGAEYPQELHNTTTTRFRVRVQNPSSAAGIQSLLAPILPRLCSQPMLAAIEVAQDTYRAGAGRRELAAIVVDRYRFWIGKPADEWHLYRKAGEHCEPLSDMLRRDLLEHLAEGWHLADCHRDAGLPVRAHAYVKAWDGGQELPLQKDWRARFEVTLRGEALPALPLDRLGELDFVRLLGQRFRWRTLADDLHPAARHALQECSARQLGRKDKYAPQRVGDKKSGYIEATPGRRRHRDFLDATQADTRLARTIKKLLDDLNKKWRQSPKLQKIHPLFAPNNNTPTRRKALQRKDSQKKQRGGSNNMDTGKLSQKQKHHETASDSHTTGQPAQPAALTKQHDTATTPRTATTSAGSASPIPSDELHRAGRELFAARVQLHETRLALSLEKARTDAEARWAAGEEEAG